MCNYSWMQLESTDTSPELAISGHTLALGRTRHWVQCKLFRAHHLRDTEESCSPIIERNPSTRQISATHYTWGTSYNRALCHCKIPYQQIWHRWQVQDQPDRWREWRCQGRRATFLRRQFLGPNCHDSDGFQIFAGRFSLLCEATFRWSFFYGQQGFFGQGNWFHDAVAWRRHERQDLFHGNSRTNFDWLHVQMVYRLCVGHQRERLEQVSEYQELAWEVQ